MIILTAAQMKALDSRAIQEAHIPGWKLMENAGAGVVTAMEETFGRLGGKAVTIICGKGNNGGDGFVVARRLRQKRVRSRALLFARPSDLTGDAKTMYQRFVKATGTASVKVQPSEHQMQQLLKDSDLVVDALLGTGLSAPVTGSYLSAIRAVNASHRPVIAVDLPSGIQADTGAILGEAIRAALTVTFGLPKLGLYLGPGIDHAGSVRIADIGIPSSYVQAVDSQIELLTLESVRAALPPRLPSSHKGTFGHVGVIAGSVGKTGAAALTANAALRTGAGLVTVATPASVNDTLETMLLEVMTLPMPETTARTLSAAGLDALSVFANARSAVAIGPGLTTYPETVELVRALLPRLQQPCVLDADALNALAGEATRLSAVQVPLVVTPHPGEMARLVSGATAQVVNSDRVGCAREFAKAHQVIVVLKGARTVLAQPDGRVAICPTGNPGMATAGSGDVLTGMIGSFLAQACPAWDSARAGTYFHGVAGDLAAEALGLPGMTAGDIIDRIPYALRQAA